MEDVLYFSQASVKLRDIAELAKSSGYLVVYPPPDTSWASRCVSIVNSGPAGNQSAGAGATPVAHWTVCLPDDSDLDLWSDEDIAKLRSYAPTSSYVVSYQVHTLTYLGRFLKRLLNVHGGWVWGSDDRIYNAETVEQIRFESIYSPDE